MSRTLSIIDHEYEALYERRTLDELIFWGVHTFKEGWWSMCCILCGNMWDEVVHNGKHEWASQ